MLRWTLSISPSHYHMHDQCLTKHLCYSQLDKVMTLTLISIGFSNRNLYLQAYHSFSSSLFSLDSYSHGISTLNHSLSLCPCAISLLLFQALIISHSLAVPGARLATLLISHSAVCPCVVSLLLSQTRYSHYQPLSCMPMCSLYFAEPGSLSFQSLFIAVPGSLSLSATLLLCQAPGSLLSWSATQPYAHV